MAKSKQHLDDPPDEADGYPLFPGFKKTDTSHQAARDVAPKVGTYRAQILDVIREAGENGLTSDEAGALCDIHFVVARPRCSELKELGLIKDSGRRRESELGKNQIVWKIIN